MKKNLLVNLLVLCMVLALSLTACSSGINTTATTAADGDSMMTTAAKGNAPATWENLSWEKDTSPVTFSCYIDYDWYTVDTWGNDEVSQEITRITGVSLDVTKGSDTQVLGVQLAAQELSDIVLTENLPQRFHDPDVCYRWDELIPEYCPEFWNLVDPLELINNQADDGHVYTFMTHYKDDADYDDPNAVGNFSPNSAICYRADIAKSLNIVTPFSSVEQLEEAFYTVKDHADEYGVSIVFNMHPNWTEIISYWMGAKNTQYWDAETKSIKLKYRDDTWLEYYKLLNKWYRDGILAKDYLGVRPEDFFSRNDSAIVFAYNYNWGEPTTVNQKWRDNGTGGKYNDLTKPVMELVVGPLTYKGENRFADACFDYGTGWNSTFISTNCDNPGRAICYMEFLKSPQGDRLTQWGIEGVHYELVDGLPKTTEEFLNRPDEDRSGTYTGIPSWYFQGSDRSEGISNGAASVLNAKDEWTKYEAQQRMADRQVRKDACRNNKNPAMSFARIESSDDEMASYTKITDQWTKSVAAMVSADSEVSVEQVWNEFQTYMETNGAAAVEAKMTERYVSNLKRYQAAGYFTDIITE